MSELAGAVGVYAWKKQKETENPCILKFFFHVCLFELWVDLGLHMLGQQALASFLKALCAHLLGFKLLWAFHGYGYPCHKKS